MLTSFDKALIPLVVAAVLAVVAHFGISGETTVNQLVTLAVTAGLVYVVPNKK